MLVFSTLKIKVIKYDIAVIVNALVFVDYEGILKITQICNLDVKLEIMHSKHLLILRRLEMKRINLDKVLLIDRRINGLEKGMSFIVWEIQIVIV